MNNKKGFTLIELLAVIVILAIIMVVAIPAVTGIITNNRKQLFYEVAEGACNALRYEVNNGDALKELKEVGDEYKKFIAELSFQKEADRSPFDAEWILDDSWVIATRTESGIEYQIRLVDDKGNCIVDKDCKEIRNYEIIGICA